MSNRNAFVVVLGVAIGCAVLFGGRNAIPVRADEEEICYMAGTWYCGETAKSCPTRLCVRAPGTFVWECRDEAGANKEIMVEQPGHSHYAESSQGLSGLTDAEETACNTYYTCGCKQENSSEYSCSGDEGDRSSSSKESETFYRRTPTGDTCPSGSS